MKQEPSKLLKPAYSWCCLVLHNLVLGRQHNFSSYGDIVSGGQNWLKAPNNAAISGSRNVASGAWAVMFSGGTNEASGEGSVIIGGSINRASGVGSLLAGRQPRFRR